VLEGVTGLRVDGSQATAVQQGLLHVLRADAAANVMGQAGYQRVQADFSWERVAQKTRALSHIQKG
jgi:glycosyltransferase involved in cell wall biosynthesis